MKTLKCDHSGTCSILYFLSPCITGTEIGFIYLLVSLWDSEFLLHRLFIMSALSISLYLTDFPFALLSDPCEEWSCHADGTIAS